LADAKEVAVASTLAFVAVAENDVPFQEYKYHTDPLGASSSCLLPPPAKSFSRIVVRLEVTAPVLIGAPKPVPVLNCTHHEYVDPLVVA
jgi:hypothetical protein